MWWGRKNVFASVTDGVCTFFSDLLSLTCTDPQRNICPDLIGNTWTNSMHAMKARPCPVSRFRLGNDGKCFLDFPFFSPPLSLALEKYWSQRLNARLAPHSEIFITQYTDQNLRTWYGINRIVGPLRDLQKRWKEENWDRPTDAVLFSPEFLLRDSFSISWNYLHANLASLFVCPPLSRHLRSCIFHSDINHTALDRGKAERERALNSFSLSLSHSTTSFSSPSFHGKRSEDGEGHQTLGGCGFPSLPFPFSSLLSPILWSNRIASVSDLFCSRTTVRAQTAGKGSYFYFFGVVGLNL